MAERICDPDGECRQYCLALDSVGGFVYAPDGSPCEWPSRLDEIGGQDLSGRPDGTLLAMLGAKLGKTLDAHIEEGNSIAQEAEQGFIACRLVFAQQLDTWKYYAKALADGRTVTDVEARYLTIRLKDTQQEAAIASKSLEAPAMTLALARQDRATLREHHLVFDEATTGIVNRLVDNVVHGRPTLLVGDKGIAKTKTAKFSAALFSGDTDVTVISGHGSMMSDELVGKVDLVEGEGTVFHEGKLVTCMREGRPLVLDEVNLADQQIMMRLQEILLKKPGESITLQENGNEPIVIQPGFCVIATANEASARYHAREQLDPAFRDRFDVIKVNYPDADTDHIIEHPTVNIRLALAHTITDRGKQIPHVSAVDAITLARLAHATQRLYSQPARDVAGNMINSTSGLVDGDEPLLTDCITPRKMVTILERVATGTLPGSTIKGEMELAIAALDQYGTHNSAYTNRVLEMLTTSSEG